jgi:hypothetical protein
VTALVGLAGRLPGHAKLSSDVRPSDAEVNSVVDQHSEFRLRCPPREPGALDPPQHFSWRQLGYRLCRTWRFPWLAALQPGLCTPEFHLAARSAHVVQHARLV